METPPPATRHKGPFKPKMKEYIATAAVANAAADQTKVPTSVVHAAEHALENESGCQPRTDTSDDSDAAGANIDNSDDVDNSLLFTVHNSSTDFSFDSPIGLPLAGDSSDTLSCPEDQNLLSQTFVDLPLVDQDFFGTFDHSLDLSLDHSFDHTFATSEPAFENTFDHILDHTFTDHTAVDQSFVHCPTTDDTIDIQELAAEIVSIIGDCTQDMESEAPSVGQDRDGAKPSNKQSPKGVTEASAFISQMMHELRDKTHVVSAILELLGMYHRHKIDETYLYIHVYSILYLNKCPPAIHEKFTTFLPRQWQDTDLEWLREGIRISLRTDAPRINAVQLEPPTITWISTPVQYRVLLSAMPIDVGGVAVEHISYQQYLQSLAASRSYAPGHAAARSYGNSPGAAYLAMQPQAQQTQQPTPITPQFPALHHRMGDEYRQSAAQFGPQQVGAVTHYPVGPYATHQASSMPDYRSSRPQEPIHVVGKNVFSQHRIGTQLQRPAAHAQTSQAATQTELRPRKKAPQIPREASPKTVSVSKTQSGTAQAAISSFRNGPAHIPVKPQASNRANKRSRADRDDSPRIEGTSILNIHTGGGRPPKRIRVPSDLSAHATSAFAALGGRSAGGRSSRARSSAGVSVDASRQDSPAKSVGGAHKDAEKDAEGADTADLGGQ